MNSSLGPSDNKPPWIPLIGGIVFGRLITAVIVSFLQTWTVNDALKACALAQVNEILELGRPAGGGTKTVTTHLSRYHQYLLVWLLHVSSVTIIVSILNTDATSQ